VTRTRFVARIVLVMAAVLVIGGGVLVGEYLRPLREFIDEGLLGPEARRQRVHVSSLGYGISFPEAWRVEAGAEDPARPEGRA
jgi:hypothetical protein